MFRHLRKFWIVVSLFIIASPAMWIGAGIGSEINSEKSKDDAFAKLAVKGDRIEWHTNGPFEKVTVTVSGPEESKYVQIFGGDSLPFFQLHDNDGNLFPDGACHYQLQMSPVSNKKSFPASLPAGREPNQTPTIEVASQETLIQSGVFLSKKARSFQMRLPFKWRQQHRKNHL